MMVPYAITSCSTCLQAVFPLPLPLRSLPAPYLYRYLPADDQGDGGKTPRKKEVTEGTRQRSWQSLPPPPTLPVAGTTNYS